MKYLIQMMCLICIVYFGYQLFPTIVEVKTENQIQKVIKQNTENHWQALQEMNSDFIGYLKFDSGIIEEPIVVGDAYLHLDFYGTESSQGTVFVLDNQTMNDQNIVLYGHRVFYDMNAKFSPLLNLYSQEYYEENSRFQIEFEDEIRTYGIIGIYSYDLRKDTYAYDSYEIYSWFEKWNEEFITRNQIKTIYSYDKEDSFITFQTCGNTDDIRVIVVAVALNRIK